MRTLLPLLLTTAVACTGKDEPGGDPGDADTGAAVDEPRVGPTYSQGACPAMRDGELAFPTGDTEYEVELRIPENPQGAPVVFAWHWLGGSASQAIRYMELEELVGSDDVILVIPESDGSQFEWHFLDPAGGNPDLLLFDDLLSCLWQEHDVDLDRIHAIGMSAGGLMTSYLTVHRSEWLASTAPLSGGAIEGAYTSPADDIPVLMTWGGTRDTYGTLSFDDTSRYLTDALRADGHFVVECVHDEGHVLPSTGLQYAWDFLMAHPKGVDPSPYADGLPDDFPSWCIEP